MPLNNDSPPTNVRSIEDLLDDFEEAVKQAAYSDSHPMGDPGNHYKHMERDEAHKALMARLAPEPAADVLRQDNEAHVARAYAAEAELARVSTLADKLWRLCVDEGWPWNDGSTQDDLAELGLLYPKDMTTAEGEDGLCESCDGDCKVCYRAVKHVRDAKQPETKMAPATEPAQKYACEWSLIEDGCNTYNTCVPGEEWTVPDDMEPPLFCCHCGGRVEIMDEQPETKVVP